MHRRTRLLISALGTLIALMALTSTAAARNRIEIEPTGPSITFTGILTFAGGGIEIICLVTLLGTVHRLVAKTLGALAGYITEGRTTGCRDGAGNTEPTVAAAVLPPCHIQYVSITGTLPTITGGTLRVRCAFLIRTIGPFGIRIHCLYEDFIEARARENPFTRLNVEQRGIRLARTFEGICPETGTLRGELGTATRVTLRLLETR